MHFKLPNQCLCPNIRVRLFIGDDVIGHMLTAIDLDMKNGYNSVTNALRTAKSMSIHIYQGDAILTELNPFFISRSMAVNM